MTKHYYDSVTLHNEDYRELNYKDILGEGKHSDENIGLAHAIAKRLESLRVSGKIVNCEESRVVMRDCILRIRGNFPYNQTALNFVSDLESLEEVGSLSDEAMQIFIENLKKEESNLLNSFNVNTVALLDAFYYKQDEVAVGFLAKDENGNYKHPDVIAHLADDNNDVLSDAIRHRRPKIVKRLLAKREKGDYEFPDVIANIGDMHFPLDLLDNTEILDCLLAQDENGDYEFPDVIPKTKDEFKHFIRHAKPECVKRLLDLPEIFNGAESQIQRFGSIVQPFVDSYISDLVFRQDEFEEEHSDGDFNLGAEDAKLCFFVLRNLIRRGESLDKINHLLAIPAVNQMAHKRKNELLKVAMRQNNKPVVVKLLQLPKVRARAAKKDYYPKEVRCKLDIKSLAQDAESLMAAREIGFLSSPGKGVGRDKEEEVPAKKPSDTPKL